MRPAPLAAALALLALPALVTAQTPTQTPGETPAQAPVQTTSPAPTQTGTFAIEGHRTTVPLTVINGRSYVDIEALARLTSGSLHSAGNAVTLNLPPSAATPGASAKAPQPEFSQPFLRAGIEQMSEIREWRIAIVNAVQNNQPVNDSWVSGYRRAAESKLALAGAAAITPSDRSAYQLLTNEFNNMQQLSGSFLNLHDTVTFTPTTAFDNNPLDVKVLACARALASMAASGTYQDEPTCH